jgi:UDP-N-acetylmuramyl pentapeptide phosphotransferase/UDP-N-acetylglucosamine-1-phosphate transferase
MLADLSPLAAALATMLTTSILLSGKAAGKIRDVPNERSLHQVPVPRMGGVGLMAGIAAAWALLLPSLAWWVVVPLLALFAVSLVDDMGGLPVRLRLLAHVGAAAILVSGSGLAAEGAWLALLAAACAVWMTNLYNFMDGSDGLAGGMALFGFGAYGAGAWLQGNETQALLNFSISAAALGFLRYNFHPAKVFMGDAGSISLGFLAAAMGLWGWREGCWPAWFPLLVFSPFAADASVTLLKRALRGEKIWLAHREHYYQRLVQIGWGHRNVALFAYALMLASGASALWGTHQPAGQSLLLLAWAPIYALLMLALDIRWQAFQRGKQNGQA